MALPFNFIRGFRENPRADSRAHLKTLEEMLQDNEFSRAKFLEWGEEICATLTLDEVEAYHQRIRKLI